MKFLLDELEGQGRGTAVTALSSLRRSYSCRCGRAVFFRNSQCLSCQSQLGYEPHLGRVAAIEPGSAQGTWRLISSQNIDELEMPYRRCANLNTAAACNWLVEENQAAAFTPYCIACRLNRTIPDLSNYENALLWSRIENAKRYVVSALISLGLPVASRLGEDPQRGMAFDFLKSTPNGPRVLTGHHNGIITLNIEEADDVTREQTRMSMREPYRTLIGHLRHETGHYYWSRLIQDSPWIDRFRANFGDERANYSAALERNYREGPQSDWPTGYVSAYASVHPWEDWAETWAHYLHMADALGTALSFGINPEAMRLPFECFGPEALCDFGASDANRFLTLLNSWLKLSAVMNELCRSMGQVDFYPFSLSSVAARKLHFVHLLVCKVRPFLEEAVR